MAAAESCWWWAASIAVEERLSSFVFVAAEDIHDDAGAAATAIANL
jgi:hypothetical protein